jgi:hypothetical protein
LALESRYITEDTVAELAKVTSVTLAVDPVLLPFTVFADACANFALVTALLARNFVFT